MIWVLNGISMICTHTHTSPGLELAGSADMITPGPVLSDRLIIQHAHKINQNYMFLYLCLLLLHTHRVSSARSIIQGKAPGQEDGLECSERERQGTWPNSDDANKRDLSSGRSVKHPYTHTHSKLNLTLFTKASSFWQVSLKVVLHLETH